MYNLSMIKTKISFLKPGFLLLQFLIEFSYYLLLFSLPFIIIMKFQSLMLVALAMMIIAATKILTPILLVRFIQYNNPRGYYILGFALQFLGILLLNKITTASTILVVSLSWALAYNLLKFANKQILSIKSTEVVGSWAFLQRPAKVAGLLFTPLIGSVLLFQTNTNDVIHYLGLLSTIAAIIYLLGFNKLGREATKSNKVTIFEKKLLKKINRSTMVTGYLTAYFWVYAPLSIYLEGKNLNDLAWILIWFNLPYLIILIWKNIFKYPIWQLRYKVKYLLFILALIPFVVGLDLKIYSVAVFFLGLLLALVQASDAQEQHYSASYEFHQISYGIGFFVAVLTGFLAVNSGSFGFGLGLLVLAILLWSFAVSQIGILRRGIF